MFTVPGGITRCQGVIDMANKAKDSTPRDPSDNFAQKLNRLFAARLSPDGDEYALTEIRDATGGRLTIAYLSLLRKGGIQHPSLDKVELLADFFGVSVTYFTDKEGAVYVDDEMSEALRKALAEPRVRELALRASELGPAEHDLYIRLLDYSKEVAARIADEKKTRTVDADNQQ